MARSALMIGWGPVVRGREQKALQVFNEAIQYYTRLQQQGMIESFEPVYLEPHGGDLTGFVLLGGEREKLNALRSSEEFLRLNNRAILVVDHWGVVTAFLGEELQRLFADYQVQASELSQATRCRLRRPRHCSKEPEHEEDADTAALFVS